MEKAAELATVKHYKSKGFQKNRVAHLSVGYDYIFKRGKTVYYVEVKGTSRGDARFFLTRNENGARNDSRWRLGMVTYALTEHPKVTIFDNQEFEEAFDLEPYVFISKRKG